MIEGWVLTLTVIVAIASGLVSGVFFAFSTFVMRALARLPAAQGVAAMQSINVTVITPLFMLALMGTAVACVVLGVAAIVDWGQDGSELVLAGSASYLAGTILMTMAFHVPRNNALDEYEPTTPDAAAYWTRYLGAWTAGNHVRVLGALGASILLTFAIVWR
ncbi:MAG: DUF1772 domain-containing protein [Acidimicrobiia bacterium]